MTRNASKLSTYATTIATDYTGSTSIFYHSTAIVRFDDEYVELHNGGWDSVTTRRKMNQAALQFGLGFGVTRHKGVSYVTTRNADGSWPLLAEAVPFFESKLGSMIIDRLTGDITWSGTGPGSQALVDRIRARRRVSLAKAA